MSSRLTAFCYKKHNYGLLAFLLALIMAAIIFVPFIVMGEGVLYYYGDFNVQEIPFYQLAHDVVRSGNFGWNYLTDLGSDFIASYSFYLLGSPFFWLTIPFPSAVVPYLIGPLMILKFACASLAAYLYIKRYTVQKIYALIGGLLYAFSGFSVYNVFFFHFHEPLIIFPLLLAALDAFLYDKRRVVFALAVACACIVNYYFFVGQVLFVLMYFLMLTLTKTYKFKIKEFLLLAFEAVTGFLISAFILLPSVLGIMGNPRLDALPNGWDSLVYDAPQKYFLILLSFFFPADTAAFPVFTPESRCKWASVAAWLPLFSMTGVIAYMQLRGKTWLKKLILLLLLFAFVPVLNSMFQLLNNSIYYARWFYILVLMFVLATVRALENRQTDWSRAVRWSTGITAGFAVLIGLMPDKIENDDDTFSYIIGVQASFERFWLYVMLAFMSILAFALIYKKFFANRRRFSAMLLLGVIITSLLTSAFVIAEGYVSSETQDTIGSNILNKRENIKIKDIDSVRSDFYECVDNTQMFWQIQSINCFQSSVSSSIMEFYEAMGITRDVASRPETSAYGLRPFLSCKYLFDYIDDDNSFIDDDGNTKMPNWKYVATNNCFDIYENECYIPMGFTYDCYVTQEEFEQAAGSHKTEALLNAMILSKEQMAKYADITGYTEEEYKQLYSKNPESFNSKIKEFRYGDDYYVQACSKLKASSCSSFEYTKNGFKAEYNNKGKENLMLFTVPYSSGFSATINGAPVEIEKASYGFMAVKIPSKTHCDIVFSYETPGLSLGLIISLAAALTLLAYYIIIRSIILNSNKK